MKSNVHAYALIQVLAMKINYASQETRKIFIDVPKPPIRICSNFFGKKSGLEISSQNK